MKSGDQHRRELDKRMTQNLMCNGPNIGDDVRVAPGKRSVEGNLGDSWGIGQVDYIDETTGHIGVAFEPAEDFKGLSWWKAENLIVVRRNAEPNNIQQARVGNRCEMMLGVMNGSINGESIDFLIDILTSIAKATTNKQIKFEGFSERDRKLYLHSISPSNENNEEYGRFVRLRMERPDRIAHFLYNWLENQHQESSNMKSHMGFDGTVVDGWRLHVGSIGGWNHIEMWFEPEHILYGK